MGELYSFGCNNCGQLGLGDVFSHINGPEKVEYCISGDGRAREPMPRIVDVAAGESHSLAVAEDGRIFTFGANLECQLGYETDRPIYGDERDRVSPGRAQKQGKGQMDTTPTPSASTSPMKGQPETDRRASVHQFANTLHEEGESKLADRGAYKLKYQPVPREIPRLGDPATGDGGFAPVQSDKTVMVDAQSRFSLAVTSQGRLYTWGSGHCCQLGNEDTEDEKTPFKVELKNRKCFWARCAGQFTMFLLGMFKCNNHDH